MISPAAYGGASVTSANLSNELANRQAAALRQAKSTQARYAAAKQAYSEGDVAVAAMLYSRVALSRQASAQMKNVAKKVLGEFQTKANRELADVRFEIRQAIELASTDRYQAAEDAEQAIETLRLLTTEYKNVPVANKQLQRELDQLLTKNEDVADLIHQPVAEALVAEAKALEEKQQLCCAFLFYEEAEKLLPCKAAKVARRQLYAWRKDADISESVQLCKKIRACQESFDKAQSIAKKGSSRVRAIRIYKEIIETAPRESEVHKAATTALAKL